MNELILRTTLVATAAIVGLTMFGCLPSDDDNDLNGLFQRECTPGAPGCELDPTSSCFDPNRSFCGEWERTRDAFSAAGHDASRFDRQAFVEGNPGAYVPDSRSCAIYYDAECAGCPTPTSNDCANAPDAVYDSELPNLRTPADYDVVVGSSGADIDVCLPQFLATCELYTDQLCGAVTPAICAQVADGTYRDVDCLRHAQDGCAELCAAEFAPTIRSTPYDRCSQFLDLREPDVSDYCVDYTTEYCQEIVAPDGCFAATESFCESWLLDEDPAAAAGASGGDASVYDGEACRAFYTNSCTSCPTVDVTTCGHLANFSVALPLTYRDTLDLTMPPEYFTPALRAVFDADRPDLCLDAYFAPGGSCSQAIAETCDSTPSTDACNTALDVITEIGNGERDTLDHDVCTYPDIYKCFDVCEERYRPQLSPGWCVNPTDPVDGGPIQPWCADAIEVECGGILDDYCNAEVPNPTEANCNGAGPVFCEEVIAEACEINAAAICGIDAITLEDCTVDANGDYAFTEGFCQSHRIGQCDYLRDVACPAPAPFSCYYAGEFHPACTVADNCGADWENDLCSAPSNIDYASCNSSDAIRETLGGIEAACTDWALDACSDAIGDYVSGLAAAEGQCFGTIIEPGADAGDFDVEGGVRSIREGDAIYDCVEFSPGVVSAQQADWAADPDVRSCEEYVYQRYYTYENWLAAIAPFEADMGLVYDAAFSNDPDHRDFAFGWANDVERLDGTDTEQTVYEASGWPSFMPSGRWQRTLGLEPKALVRHEQFTLEAQSRNDFITILRDDDSFVQAIENYLPGDALPPAIRDQLLAENAAIVDDALDNSHANTRVYSSFFEHEFLGHWLRRRNRRTDCPDDAAGNCVRADIDEVSRPLYSDEELAHWYNLRKRFVALHNLYAEVDCTSTACDEQKRAYVREARAILKAAWEEGCLEPSSADFHYEKPGFAADFPVARVCDWAPQDFFDSVTSVFEAEKANVLANCERVDQWPPNQDGIHSFYDDTGNVINAGPPHGGAPEILWVQVPVSRWDNLTNWELYMHRANLHFELAPLRERFLYIQGIINNQMLLEQATADAIATVTGAPVDSRPLWGQYRGDRIDYGNNNRVGVSFRYGTQWRLTQPPGTDIGLTNDALCQTNTRARVVLETTAFIRDNPHHIIDASTEINAREGVATTRLKVSGFTLYNENEFSPGDFSWNYAADDDAEDRVTAERDISLWSFAGLNVFMRVGVAATAGMKYDNAGVYDVDPFDCTDGDIEMRAMVDARPYAAGSAFVEAGFDFVVVEVSVGGEITILDIAVPVDFDVHVDGSDAYHADVDVDTEGAVEYTTGSGKLYLKVTLDYLVGSETWKKTFAQWHGKTRSDDIDGLRSFNFDLGEIYDYCLVTDDSPCYE